MQIISGTKYIGDNDFLRVISWASCCYHPSLSIALCSYLYLLMYAVFHCRSSTLYQADYFLLSTRRHQMSVPDQNAPDLREESSSSIGSDSFHFLVQKADSMALVTRQISPLLDTRFDNFN